MAAVLRDLDRHRSRWSDVDTKRWLGKFPKKVAFRAPRATRAAERSFPHAQSTPPPEPPAATATPEACRLRHGEDHSRSVSYSEGQNNLVQQSRILGELAGLHVTMLASANPVGVVSSDRRNVDLRPEDLRAPSDILINVPGL